MIYRNLVSEGIKVYKKALDDEHVLNNLIADIRKRTRAKVDNTKIKEQLKIVIEAYLSDKELSPVDLELEFKDQEQE